MTTREKLLAQIARLPDGDELAVLASVAEGLERGLAVYGPLALRLDARDFNVETVQENRDALVYQTAQLLRMIR